MSNYCQLFKYSLFVLLSHIGSQHCVVHCFSNQRSAHSRQFESFLESHFWYSASAVTWHMWGVKYLYLKGPRSCWVIVTLESNKRTLITKLKKVKYLAAREQDTFLSRVFLRVSAEQTRVNTGITLLVTNMSEIKCKLGDNGI